MLKTDQNQPATQSPRAQEAIKSIAATLTRCRHGQALVVLDSGPFNGLEIRPGALREMARQLSALADMAARLPTGGKHWRATRVEVGAAEQPVAAAALDAESMQAFVNRYVADTGSWLRPSEFFYDDDERMALRYRCHAEKWDCERYSKELRAIKRPVGPQRPVADAACPALNTGAGQCPPHSA